MRYAILISVISLNIVLSAVLIQRSTCGRDQSIETVLVPPPEQPLHNYTVSFQIFIPGTLKQFYLAVSGNTSGNAGYFMLENDTVIGSSVMLRRGSDEFSRLLNSENESEYSGRVFFSGKRKPQACLFIGKIGENSDCIEWNLVATVNGDVDEDSTNKCSTQTKIESDLKSCLAGAPAGMKIKFNDHLPHPLASEQCRVMNLSHFKSQASFEEILTRRRVVVRGWLVFHRLPKNKSSKKNYKEKSNAEISSTGSYLAGQKFGNFMKFLRLGKHYCCIEDESSGYPNHNCNGSDYFDEFGVAYDFVRGCLGEDNVLDWDDWLYDGIRVQYRVKTRRND